MFSLRYCHEDLHKIVFLAILRSKVDFGITKGYRYIERQKILYHEGKSKIDGVKKRSKHNQMPSMALDIYCYHPDIQLRQKIIYSKSHLAYIAGIIDSCAMELFDKGEITHKIRWGGNWDGDGVIDFDQSFDDFPHFELI